jgi:DNA-binding MarR family transcriptional regulator
LNVNNASRRVDIDALAGPRDIPCNPRALRLVAGATCESTGGRPTTAAATELEVRAVQALRRKRGAFFDPALFADPAWDILLELYAAELGQQRVTVSNLCKAVAAPATTALRWIDALERRGIIRRTGDPTDRRRFFVALAPDAFVAMNRFFKATPAPRIPT